MARARRGWSRIPLPGKILAILLVTASVISVAALWVSAADTVRVTAYFTNSVGLYPGDRVALRGVPIGEIDEIAPMGDRVRVTMHFDSRHPVSADTHAVIVAPTLVSGRYVQLTPQDERASALRDGAVIPLERTAVPMEYDDIKQQVTDLAEDLAPKPGDPAGTLGRFVDTAAKTLGGNGATLNSTLVNLSKAMQTLSTGGPDLFATVRNLQTFVTALEANDEQVRNFVSQLSGASNLLNDNRTQMDAALQAIDAMLPELRSVIADNRNALNADVSSLIKITSLLVNREDDIARVLHSAPTALDDLYNIYDPASRSLTGFVNIPDLPDPMSLICALLTTVDAPQQECSRASAQFGDLFNSAARAAMGTKPAPSQPGPDGGPPALPGLPPIPGLNNLLIPGAGR